MELVASHYPPLTLTATFELACLDSCLEGRSEGKVVWSECHGYGWRFGISRRYNRNGFSSESGEIKTLFDLYQAAAILQDNTQLRIQIILASDDGKSAEFQDIEPHTITKRSSTSMLRSFPSSSFVGRRFISFVVTIASRFGFQSQLDIGSLSPALRGELNASLRRGGFTDTKFFAFSRRRATGGAERPKELFANSVLLKEKSEYFLNLLSDNGFLESTPSSDERQSRDSELPFTDSYEYGSDSDLEDVEDMRDAAEEDEDSSEDAFDASDSDHIETDLPEHDVKSALALPVASSHISHTVTVKDCAYVTWNALIFYLYTGHIAFSPLTSDVQHHREAHDAQYQKDHPDCPLPCSAKSMYRVADKLGLDELKQLAFQKIVSGITADNIVEEYLSSFTSRYQEVRDFELSVLREHYKKSPAVRTALQERSSEMLGKSLQPDELRSLAQFFFDSFRKLML